MTRNLTHVTRCFCLWGLCIGLLPGAFVIADELAYKQEVLNKVSIFASRNRIKLAVLNRDVHADCYIPITISIAIRRDGTVEEVSIVKSSTVPVVDNWYRWIIQQAAPYPPLETHYDPVPDEIIITHEFKLDVRLWSENVRSTKPCEPLRPLHLQLDQEPE